MSRPQARSVVGKHVTFDCLLPTGLLLSVSVGANDKFEDVKRELWAQAAQMPLFAVLKESSQYGLRFVSKHGDVLELDDDQTVGHTSFYMPVLKVFLRKGSREEQKLNVAIGSLISKHLSDFDNMRDPEVTAYRTKAATFCSDIVTQRDRGGFMARALHRYAPSLDPNPLPSDLKKKANPFHVKIKIPPSKDSIVKANVEGTVNELIQQALKKDQTNDSPDNFVLRVSGRDEYLLGNSKLYQYKVVRRALSRGYEKKDFSDVLVLLLEPKKSLMDSLGQVDRPLPAAKRAVEDARGAAEMLWFSKEANTKFVVKINEARNVVGNLSRLFGIGVKAAVYMGEEMICKPETTRYIAPVDNPVWGQWLEFELDLKNIPRSSRLCLLLHGVWGNPLKVKKKSKNVRNEFPLAWANVTMFDHRGCLRSGAVPLTMWNADPPDNDEDELFVPMGSTLPSPMRNNAPFLTIEFATRQRDLVFPDSDYIDGSGVKRAVEPLSGPAEQEFKRVQTIVKADPLYRLSAEERQLLRKYRFYLKDRPEALAKCLAAVDWTRMEASQEVAAMLKEWAVPSEEQALGLLDARFADQEIRTYAVRVLDRMTDESLLLYLLQLVQVLKYEAFLDCELARFLTRRALINQRIGHFFFWFLKSEMHLEDVNVRYGLMLEAFCRSSEGHMMELMKQNDALQRMERLAEALKDKAIKDKVAHVRENLQPKELGVFQLPLDPSLRVAECECRKVFDSAQKPIWFCFRNVLPDGPEANIMFKRGDDLRQDMLTLQLIRVMDQLWQENGLDLQMSAYDCLATGDEVGMLEMVMNSATLWRIQGTVGSVLWDDTVINNWLKTKNPTDEGYNKACDAFLMSCAGYSVATYVLGIADRHNDNIMLKESGQLFHIDFGHFLGNWKEKFGVRRERVKFILVPDFVVAMTRGGNQRSPKWKLFKDVCKQAYLIVRRHADLFINLLNMMLATGIPELRSRDDVNYLRDTLFLQLTEDEAAERFMQEIEIALRDSKTVKVNWAFHGVRH